MRTVHVGRLALALVTALVGASSPASAADAPSAMAFDRFKALQGEWLAAEDGEMVTKGDLVARYALTGGGSAVVETLFPGSPHEMLTVYTAEGSDVVLTHYCVSGNQPRMRAKAPAGTRVEFAFDGGTNLRPAADRHMHSAWIDFVGRDELRSEWTEHAEGQTAKVVRMHLVRRTG